MEVRESVYWKLRLDNVVSDYKNWSVSVFHKLRRSLPAVTGYPVINNFKLIIITIIIIIIADVIIIAEVVFMVVIGCVLF